MLAVDLSTCRPGRVVRVHGLVSVVEAEDDGKEYRCGVRRILKTLAIDGRNVVAVGRPASGSARRGPTRGRSRRSRAVRGRSRAGIAARST